MCTFAQHIFANLRVAMLYIHTVLRTYTVVAHVQKTLPCQRTKKDCWEYNNIIVCIYIYVYIHIHMLILFSKNMF